MSVPREQLLTEVSKVLRSFCGVEFDVRESSRLAEDLQLDSVGLLSLAVNLENQYRIRIADDPTTPPQTVGDVIDLLQSALSGQEEPA